MSFFKILNLRFNSVFYSTTNLKGYQGSEKDDEISGTGNSYTTFFRQLDPRLGRWFSPDPVFQPWQCPYTSMDNNPINLTDVLGNATDQYVGEPTLDDLNDDDNKGGDDESSDDGGKKKKYDQDGNWRGGSKVSTTRGVKLDVVEVSVNLQDGTKGESSNKKYYTDKEIDDAFDVLIDFLEAADKLIDDTKGEREQKKLGALGITAEGDGSSSIGPEVEETLMDLDMKEVEKMFGLLTGIMSDKKGGKAIIGKEERVKDRFDELRENYGFKLDLKNPYKTVKGIMTKVKNAQEALKQIKKMHYELMEGDNKSKFVEKARESNSEIEMIFETDSSSNLFGEKTIFFEGGGKGGYPYNSNYNSPDTTFRKK